MKTKLNKLEGVIVCVNYSDFLAASLPHNKGHFNKLVVVTDTKDLKTKNVCDTYDVMCIQTDVFYENGFVINKAAGINEGLKHLDKDGWVLHLDADIVMIGPIRDILNSASLNPEYIYGCDRIMIPEYYSWQNFISSPKPLFEGWIYIHTENKIIGTRLAEYKSEGWNVLGFFQLWNPKISNIYDYPKDHGDIDRSDVIHSKRWPRSKRQFIPELLVYHIDSEDSHSKYHGVNWKGRKTAPFTLEHYMENMKQSYESSLTIKDLIKQLYLKIKKML